MKKIIYILIGVLFLNNIYSEGIADRENDPFSPFQDLIQIKLINMTDTEIEFFYNKYYFPTKISPNDFYITKQIPKNYKNACFFIIKYGNGKANIYNFNDTDHWLPILYQFHITIFETGIKIFTSPLDQEYDYSDVSLYEDFYTKSMWGKWEWNNTNKNILLINSSDLEINVYIYDAYTELKEFKLKPGEEDMFEENQTLFQLRPIEVLQTNNTGNHDYNKFLLYHKWYDYKDINIVFNNKGYEIIYR